MNRQSRLTNSRHPYLTELDNRFYGSLDYINFRPKNIFSIDIFPDCKNKPKHSFFKEAKWFDGSSLAKDPKPFTKRSLTTDFVKILSRYSKKKKIYYPSRNNQYTFADKTFDYIEALAVIPWENDPVALITEIHRLLDSGGFFGFASFGPETLKTLITSLNSDNKCPVSSSFLPMIDLHDIGDFCMKAGFVNPVVASNIVCFKYNKAETALKELRILSGNARSDRDGFLRGKNWHLKIMNALNNSKDSDGLVTLEFELIYGHAWKGEKNSSKIEKNLKYNEKKINLF